MEKLDILRMLATGGFVSLFAAFLLMLAYKWGIVEWLQVHGCKRIAEMAHCDFCMSWWLCVVLTVFFSPFISELWMLAVPFVATPLTRHWL